MLKILKRNPPAPPPSDWDEPKVLEPLPNRRLRLVARVAFIWAALVFLRLVQLQVVRHQDFRNIARSQQEKDVEILAPRGTIFDRNGAPLAMTTNAKSGAINRSSDSARNIFPERDQQWRWNS